MRVLLEILLEGLLSSLVTAKVKTFSAAICRGLISCVAAFACLLIGWYIGNPNLTMMQIGRLAFWCVLFGLVVSCWLALGVGLGRLLKR